jgi:hypothetical protein
VGSGRNGDLAVVAYQTVSSSAIDDFVSVRDDPSIHASWWRERESGYRKIDIFAAS